MKKIKILFLLILLIIYHQFIYSKNLLNPNEDTMYELLKINEYCSKIDLLEKEEKKDLKWDNTGVYQVVPRFTYFKDIFYSEFNKIGVNEFNVQLPFGFDIEYNKVKYKFNDLIKNKEENKEILKNIYSFAKKYKIIEISYLNIFKKNTYLTSILLLMIRTDIYPAKAKDIIYISDINFLNDISFISKNPSQKLINIKENLFLIE